MLLNPAILHLDLDSFFVSVERLRNPKLEGIPLIIGGASDRGVVAACSYEARRFGVHSAMPIRLARRLCPHALFIGGDMELYSRHSTMVTDMVRDKAPLFEKASIDEFYLDLNGMDKFIGVYRWASELRHYIQKESGLPISFGLSANKMVSKVATGEAKPAGQLHVERGMEPLFLAPLPVSRIPMVGEKTAGILRELGVHKIAALREIPREMLERIFGKAGHELWRRARGIDESPVVPYVERKSISTETTLEEDSIDVYRLRSTLRAMAERLAFQLRAEGRLCACLSVRVRYSDFTTVSKQIRISCTASDQVLSRKAVALFDALYDRRIRLRLVGLRLSELLTGSYQISLLEDTQEQLRLFQAVDKMRHRHGATVLMRANAMDSFI